MKQCIFEQEDSFVLDKRMAQHHLMLSVEFLVVFLIVNILSILLIKIRRAILVEHNAIKIDATYFEIIFLNRQKQASASAETEAYEMHGWEEGGKRVLQFWDQCAHHRKREALSFWKGFDSS